MLATDKSQGSRQWITDLFFIALFLSMFYAIWIGSYALFTPDEGRYSEVAREMVASGDYVTPRLDGVAFLDKPALYYWLQASAINLFGLKEWALRLWPAAIGILGCLMTYVAGYTLFNRRTGVLAAIILATSPIYYGAAHYANLELEVGVLLSSSLIFFLLGVQESLAKWRTALLLTAYVFAAGAFLTKGLIGIAFPVMIIGTWIVLLNRWQTLLHMRIFSGLCLFFALVVPWYYYVQIANPEFLHFFFVTQQVTRFLTKATFNSQAVFWFYVPVVLFCFLPWSIFLIQTLAFQIKAIWQNRQRHQNELFLLLWATIIFIFFSIPKSKTVGYIIPVFPAIALLTARYLDHYWDTASTGSLNRTMKSFIGLMLLIAGICLALPYQHFIEIDSGAFYYLHISTIIFLLSAIMTIFCLRQPTIARFIKLLTITACLSLLTLIASTKVINTNTIKPLALQLKTQMKPGDEIIAYHRYYQDLSIYLEQRITIVADWHAADIQYNDNWQRELWYGMPFQDTSAWLIEDNAFWQRWNGNKHIYAFMKKSYYKDFVKMSQHPIFKIGEYNDVLLISNQA